MVGERFGRAGWGLRAVALLGVALLAAPGVFAQSASGGASAQAAKPAVKATTGSGGQTGASKGAATGGQTGATKTAAPTSAAPKASGGTSQAPAPTDPSRMPGAPAPNPTLTMPELLAPPAEEVPRPPPPPPPLPPPPEAAAPPPPPAPTPPPAEVTGPELVALEKPIPITFDRKVLYEIRVASKKHPAEGRARGAEKALLAALEEGEEVSVRAEDRGDLFVVYAGKIPVIQLFPEDATAHGHSSLAFHADDVAVRFDRLLEA